MVQNQFKSISEGLGFFYLYGLGHWLNLDDMEDDVEYPANKKNVLVKLWEVCRTRESRTGHLLNTEWEGKLTIGVRSRIDDEDYQFKFENHIEWCYGYWDQIVNSFDACGYVFTYDKINEYENYFDHNEDGIIIEFKVKEL